MCYIKWVTTKDNTVNRLHIMVRLCSHYLSFHLKIQIPMKSNQVTVYEWALEFKVCPRSSDPFYIVNVLYKMGHYFLDTQYVHKKVTKITESFLFFKIENVFIISFLSLLSFPFLHRCY